MLRVEGGGGEGGVENGQPILHSEYGCSLTPQLGWWKLEGKREWKSEKEGCLRRGWVDLYER